MKFNKAKCKILHLGWGSPKHKYRLDREWVEIETANTDLVFEDENLSAS